MTRDPASAPPETPQAGDSFRFGKMLLVTALVRTLLIAGLTLYGDRIRRAGQLFLFYPATVCCQGLMRMRNLLFSLLLFLLLPAAGAVAAAPITSAAEIEFPPFSIATDEGEADGFSVELLRAAVDAMGREVSFRTGPWAQVRGLLEKGEIEVLPVVGRTPEREALFDFTFPYMSLYGAIVVRDDSSGINDLNDLRGRQVAVMKGDNAEEFLRREERGIKIVTTTTFEQALRGLSAGDHDAVVVQRLVALRLIQKTGLDNLRVIERPLEEFRQDFSFAVTKGDSATLALLNEGLARALADGSYQRLYVKWFAALELPQRQRLIIGGDDSFPPYEYLDERGFPTGFVTELTRAIAQEVGLDIEIRLGPWSQVLRQLELGEIDAIQGMFYSPERDQLFDFGPSHLLSHYVSVTRRNNRAPPESFEELDGLRIIAQRDDVIVEELHARELTAQLTLVDTLEEALQQLVEGKQDCALGARIPILWLMQKNGWDGLQTSRNSFLERGYAYSVRNGQQALLAKLNEGLELIKVNGEYRRIHDKWMTPYREPPQALWVALRYSAIVLAPLLLVLLVVVIWTWALRRQVAVQLRQIRENQARLQAITRTALDAIVMTDPRGQIVFCNPAAAQLFGYSPQELLENQLPLLLGVDSIDKLYQQAIDAEDMDSLDLATARILERNARSKDGRDINVELSLATVMLGQERHAVVVIRDVSERKLAERALQKKNEEMEQFVYTVSHDLKSPLFTIKTFVGMLQQSIADGQTERVESDVAYIRDAADKIAQRLEALLRLSRIGRTDNQPATTTLKALVDDCTAALAGAIKEQQVEVVVSDVPVQLHADLMKLGQIWQNLVENAIKYKGDQPRPRIAIGAQQKGAETIFFVEDNGMGIDPQHGERIFQMFAQLHPGSDGVGLGLPLVKKVVELYGGRIWVESAGAGQGSCFYFTLPKALLQHEGKTDDASR